VNNKKHCLFRELFEKHGASVLECDIMKNKNYAFVHIETNSDKKIAEQIIRKFYLNVKIMKSSDLRMTGGFSFRYELICAPKGA